MRQNSYVLFKDISKCVFPAEKEKPNIAVKQRIVHEGRACCIFSERAINKTYFNNAQP